MAGRIPQSFIEDLLERTDILEVIGKRIRLKKTGRNYSALCPFHQEKTPSFSVSPDKHLYHCFGCGASGDAINFVMDYDKLDFPEAVESLAHDLGLSLPQTQAPQISTAQLTQRQRGHQLLTRATDFYRQQLTHATQAQAYLGTRALSAEIQARFALGYAPPAWDALKTHLLQAGFSEQEQIHAGTLVQHEQGRTYDRMRHRLIFPIRDRKGQVIGFGGRVLDESKPKYLNSPETDFFHKSQALYGLYEVRQSATQLKRLVLVEGYMDVLALADAGIPYALATLGTAVTAEHLQQVFRLVTEVVFCFDGDAAGLQAAERTLAQVLPLLYDGRQARFLFLPQGEDPDSLVHKEGAQGFEQRLVHAMPLAEFLIRHLSQNLNLHTLDGGAQLVHNALPFVNKLPEGILRHVIISRLSQLSQLDQQVIQQWLVAHANKANPVPATPTQSSSKSLGTQAPVPQAFRKTPLPLLTLGQRVLKSLLECPQLALQQAEKQEKIFRASHEFTFEEQQLAFDMLAFIRSFPQASYVTLLAHWQGTTEGQILTYLAQALRKLSLEQAQLEYQDLLHQLEQKLHAPQRAQRLQFLLTQAQSGHLAADEKQEMYQLLRQKNTKKATKC
ncbi:DNA primase [Allopseudospirillum japonicum]|uniref:DNA primase n=1 Tax=Allopseudospirillum japonicum TaxID=64971 RepID=A0A1H6S0C4_9GAMM|nr:DNA primase [Allopseudospirillum japonicum]SEI59294.1 DNA primase [Allopseudospirillum japonicum]